MASVSRDAQIRRKDVPESDRTPDRDKAAEAIETMWPATFTEIGEETGFSRQHISNTFDLYFEEIHEGKKKLEKGGEVTIEIPDDVDDPAAYVEGYMDGFRDGMKSE